MSNLPFLDKMIHIHLMGTPALYEFIFIVWIVLRDKNCVTEDLKKKITESPQNTGCYISYNATQ